MDEGAAILAARTNAKRVGAGEEGASTLSRAVSIVRGLARILLTLPQGFRSHTSEMKWAAAGFVAGALVWHVLGFWHFVATVVLKGPEPEYRSARLPPAMITTGSITRPAAAAGIEAAAVAVPNCSALSLDHESGITRSGHCPPRVSPVRHVTGSGRSDLGKVRVSPHAPAAAAGGPAGWAAATTP